jgi:hypothetical protein
MNERLKEPVRRVLELLTHAKYAELETLTQGVRLSAGEMAKAIAEYGRTLATPPEDAFALMDVIEVRNATPRRWSITMPLWTREEGRSDLTIELTVVEGKTGFGIELDDVHVL